MLPVRLALLLAAELGTPPAPPQPLLGAGDAETCEFPTVGQFTAGALFGQSCAATVIHPQIALTYYECPVAFIDPLTLGEDEPGAELAFLTGLAEDDCAYVGLNSLAVCVLAEPVLDLPRTPLVAGCETGILEPGREVVITGFGAGGPDADGTDPFAGAGRKRWATAKIIAAGDHNLRLQADPPLAACGSLDLGAGVYIRYPDESWHLAGIVVESIACSGDIIARRVDSVLPELQAMVDGFGGSADVTPCHDGEGAWSPTDACGDFALDPGDAAPSWDDLCAATPRSGPSTTCGPAFGDDAATPGIRFVSPSGDVELVPGERLSIELAVNHPVVEVRLEIDGVDAGAGDASWPFGFANVEFPAGTYVVEGVAVGQDGTDRKSTPIVVTVGSGETSTGSSSGTSDGSADATSTGAPPTSEGGSSGALAGSDTTAVVVPSEGDGGGCGCASGLGSRASLAWLLAVPIARRRRRSTSRRPCERRASAPTRSP